MDNKEPGDELFDRLNVSPSLFLPLFLWFNWMLTVKKDKCFHVNWSSFFLYDNQLNLLL